MKLLNNNTRFLRNCIYALLFTIDRILKRHTNIFVLCYHSISNDNWLYTVTSENFKNQITSLLTEGYIFIPLSSLKKHIATHPNGKYVVLNFDDGYKNILSVVSFLSHRKIVPTLFALGNTEKANRHELDNMLPFLNDRELKTLVKTGWEIGSHTQTHSDLSNLSEKVIIEEVLQSKLNLEKKLGKKVFSIAYPRGRYSNIVISAARKAGYTLGLSMDDDFINSKTNLYKIPRIGVDNTHTINEFKTIYSPSNILFRKFIKKSFLGRYL